jgi:hypothetical protein
METSLMLGPVDHCEDSGFYLERDEKLSENSEQRKNTT